MKALAKYIWLDGEIVEWEKATVHVLTHALHYGTGVFEGIRAYSAENDLLVFKLKDHIKRLTESAKIYSLDLPYTPNEIHTALVKLIKQNDFHSSLYIRPIAFKGLGGIGLDIRNVPVSVSIIAVPFDKYFGKPGLDVHISTWRRLGEPSVPAIAKASGHYVNSVLARTEATQLGFDEALFLDGNGNVSEGTGENIFIAKDGVIFTPPVTSNILRGITRDTVITLVHDEGMMIEERAIARAELYTCDEAFFSGTAAEIAPIMSVDRKMVGNGKIGPITIALQKQFEQLVTGRNEKYLGYLTSVYGKHPRVTPLTAN